MRWQRHRRAFPSLPEYGPGLCEAGAAVRKRAKGVGTQPRANRARISRLSRLGPRTSLLLRQQDYQLRSAHRLVTEPLTIFDCGQDRDCCGAEGLDIELR